jgi:hemolysin activation/secretion protein
MSKHLAAAVLLAGLSIGAAAGADDLPIVPVPTEAGTERLSAGGTVRVERYEVSGATVLGTAELDAIVAPYRGRDVTWSDLAAMRDAITLAYVKRGYVSSGAVIPDQTIENGIVRVEIVEGTVGKINVETDGRYRTSTLAHRLERVASGPANVPAIETELKLLQQDERIRSVNARLLPGETRGSSLLDVKVAERRPWAVALDLGNDGVPSVGSERARLSGSFAGLAGIGDRLHGSVAATDGSYEGDLGYDLPLGSRGTSLAVYGRGSTGRIVEEPFEPLDIRSDTWTFGATVRQSLQRSPTHGWNLTFGAEMRRSESYLLGTGFSFSEGTEEGVAKITVVRLGQEWFHRTPRSALALRATESFGLDALGATVNEGNGIPDGQFVSLLLQAQWARRFSSKDALLILRLDGQASSAPLFGLEQLAVGGRASVRGYRETTLVRDQGAVGSAEMRFPIVRRGSGLVLEVGPFVDGGFATNKDRPDSGPRWIAGAGVTAHLNVGRYLLFSVDYAEALRELTLPPSPTLQDHGLYIQLTLRTP